MNMQRFLVTPSPHIRSNAATWKIMLDVIIALIPAVIAGVWFFGMYTLAVVMVSVAAAVLSEALAQWVMHRKVTVSDLSAVVMGILLALCLPPTVPLWIPAAGSAFGIIVVKQFFGGIGQNIVNPALAARAFLMLAWPLLLTTGWILPDALSSATPLVALKHNVGTLPSWWALFTGQVGGSIGETSAIAILLGGIYLMIRRVISWRIPAATIGITALLAWVLGGKEGLFTGDAIYHILSGGLLLGAVFMATDYTTSPMTTWGQLLFGAGCGILTVFIRIFGEYPEGVCYAILIMNLFAPLIERATRPRIYGKAGEVRHAR